VKTPDLYVQAIGVHLPEGRVTVEDALSSGLCGDEFVDTNLLSIAVADGVSAVDMAVDAAGVALGRAGLDPARLDLLVHAAMFRQGPPGWAPVGYLLRELGCGTIAGYEVNQGCNGLLAAMELAAGWLTLAGGPATALVTTSLNANTTWLDRWGSGGFGIALGDGAAAMVLGKGSGIVRVDCVNSMTYAELEALHRGDLSLYEQEIQDSTKVDLPVRAAEFAVQNGYDAMDFHRRFVTMYTEVMTRSLKEAGVEPADLKKVIFSNIGEPLVASTVLQPLGLPMSRTPWDFGRTIGHIGAADHAISLDHLLRTGQLEVGDRVLMLSGTSGYTVASAVLTVTKDFT
jgi:3-oxoacyl-[acyl-carrier-protein] synthase-3